MDALSITSAGSTVLRTATDRRHWRSLTRDVGAQNNTPVAHLTTTDGRPEPAIGAPIAREITQRVARAERAVDVGSGRKSPLRHRLLFAQLWTSAPCHVGMRSS